VSRLHQVEVEREVEVKRKLPDGETEKVTELRMVGEVRQTILSTHFLPDELVAEIKRYRNLYSAMNERHHAEAVLRLPKEAQDVYHAWQNFSADEAKRQLCAKYGLDPAKMPWDQMTSSTMHISKAVLAAGHDRSEVHRMVKKKGKKEREVKKRDRAWVSDFKPTLPEEVWRPKREHLLDIQRESEEYRRLTIFKQQLVRRCVNHVVKVGERESQCEKLVFAIEDLNVKGFFFGKGKNLPGWEGFFQHKRENRFIIREFHRAFSELGPHRGYYVLEANPGYTSCTCPDCRHPDPVSRNGERFKCTRCGATHHADSEVATYNIAQVAIMGKALPRPKKQKKPKRERSGAVKKAETARKRNGRKSNGKGGQRQEAPLLRPPVRGTAREPVANASC